MSSGPPPPPPDPERAAESNLGRILGVTTTFHVIAVTFLALRLYVRIRIVKSHGRDDWTMVAAVLCAFGGWLIFVLEGLYGLGHHEDTVDPLDLIKLSEVSFWQSIISANVAMALLKISIALNLLRLSPGRWYTWSLWASIAFVCAYSFMGCMTFFLHCRPMAKHWDYRLDGECYPVSLFVTFALINTSFNIFTDVLFATFPIPMIARLQMKRKTRMYLIGILSLGYFAVVMGILKTIYQIAFASDTDKIFNQWVTFWGFLQLNIGIIAACAPSLKPLVSRVLKLSDYYPTSASHYGSRTRGTVGLQTIGGTGGGGGPSSARRSKHPDQYELQDLRNSDDEAKQSSEEVDFGGLGKKGHSSATATFYKGSESEGDRSGSEEMILGARQGQQGPPAAPNHGGIMRTTEVIVK